MAATDPFVETAVTALRPRPGAGKRSSHGNGPPAPSSGVVSSSVVSVDAPDVTAAGLNPLVQAATPLLLFAAHLRGSLSTPDVAALRAQTMREIRRFEERARSSGVSNEVVLAARYVLCAGLDEAVLTTPWGAQSEWAQQTLLVTLHREPWGGEKFFELLHRISADPAKYLDLMELQYLCVAFGFAGKYRVDERGQVRLVELQEQLFKKISDARPLAPTALSPRWKGLDKRRNPIVRYIPWWIAAAATLALFAMTFALFYTRLATAAAPVHAALATIGTEAFAPTVTAAPADGPRLKALLAPDEQRGDLTVEEQGGRTVITLGAGRLFPSGSAVPADAEGSVLRSVATALNRVPGRVLVVGHTDDQPLSSWRYHDNFELSRDRALAVVKLLQKDIDNAARIEWTGVGPTQPRYRPADDTRNRARNRRVEIIHISDRER